MDNTSKILIAATIVGLGLLVVDGVVDRKAKRDLEEQLRIQARAQIAAAEEKAVARKAEFSAQADDLLREANNALAVQDYESAIEILSPWRDLLPPDHATALGNAENAVAKIAADSARETAKFEAEIQRDIDAKRARLGDMPIQSAWDGSYTAIEAYLKKMAHDPGSIEFDGCSKPAATDKGWHIRCVYRGKNAFGALVRNDQWFLVRHGEVISVD